MTTPAAWLGNDNGRTIPGGVHSHRPAISGRSHMVSSGHYLAAAAGYRILENGGNAIDAGVASGIVINVVLPENTSFGGVAPIMVYNASSNEVTTISGLGRWPRAASAMFFREQTGGEIPLGILRSIVPSAVDSWLTALKLYGTMTFEEVVTPALELAEEGLPMQPVTYNSLTRDLDSSDSVLKQWPSSQAVFLPDGHLPAPFEPFLQPDLAHTFQRLIEAEREAAGNGRAQAIDAARNRFYCGDIAQEMADFSEEQGGLLTYNDFAEFTVRIEDPVSAQFRDDTIYTCGPWSQGPVVAQTLQTLENDDLAALGHNSPDYIHLVSQALNLSFADRHAFYGDPDFVDVPIDELLSRNYTKQQRQRIDMDRAFEEMPAPGQPADTAAAAPKPETMAGQEEMDTSFTCVVDRWGNGFAATPSDALFHSPIVPGLGIIMSGRGSQSWLEEDHPSKVEPGKRPRLTPNPSMAFRNGKLFMTFGCPGGDAQPQAMVQLYLNVVEFGMDPQSAIEVPRFTSSNFPNSFWPHTYWPGRLNLEGRIDSHTIEALSKRGHDILVKSDWEPMSVAALSAIVIDPDTGTLIGGADPRRDTYAIGR